MVLGGQWNRRKKIGDVLSLMAQIADGTGVADDVVVGGGVVYVVQSLHLRDAN